MNAHAGDDGRWPEVMALIERWLDADEDARRALLDDVARDDAQLHARLAEAIRTDGDAEAMRFLAGSALMDVARTQAPETKLRDLAGQRIGPWRVTGLLGVGGMGQVWRVRRDDGRHAGEAALKMLRFAALDPAAQQRFAREGELLARLQHPHVARLLDVGETDEGQRYLVLEYVDGERVDHWCDRHKATIDARLRLFLQVCEAISYAHANLIVHRDLKPSNILVQADSQAKVLDFGTAKLLEADGAAEETSELTRAGGAAFTPEYAAPEQFDGKPVTVATDVYSLGVVLYLLLAGRRSYGDTEPTPAQLARAIREHEPRRPSAAAAERTGDTAALAAARATTPEQLRRALRGDLDTILAKALKREPAERYASVAALADDVRRHLEHRPILARGDSAGYRLRKYLRRHRVGAAIGALLALAIVAGVAGVLWQAEAARREAARATAVKQFLIDLFDDTRNTRAGIQVRRASALDILNNGAERLKTELGEQPEMRDELYETLIEIFDSSGDTARSEELARARVAAAETAFGADDARVVSALTTLAGVYSNHDKPDAAKPLLARSEALLDRARDGDSLERARLWTWQGNMQRLEGGKDAKFEGNPLLRAVELLRRKYPREDDREVALMMYTQLAVTSGHLAEAESAAAEMHDAAVAKYGADTVYVAQADFVQARILLREEKFDAALARVRDAEAGFLRFEGAAHPDLLYADFVELQALIGLKRFDEARALFAKADAARREKLAGDKRLEKGFADIAAKLGN
ncbi:MAG: serine/threonine-protein kinase [Rudaea sp.]|uniref:serine/threonine-protein kinase n=1 Tax=Rudaea sp. TaxID=2136325 RepID=UPI0039E63845